MAATVETRALPALAVTQIPAVAKYNYGFWHDQVLLNAPATGRVADILHDYILRDQR